MPAGVDPNRLGSILRQSTEVAPLLPVAIGLVSGVIVDQIFELTPVIYVGVFVCAAVALLRRRERVVAGSIAILVAAIAVGACLHMARVRAISHDSIERHLTGEQRLAQITGRIASQPRVLQGTTGPFSRWSFGSPRTVFLLDVESIAGHTKAIRATGRIRVTVGEAILSLNTGERVEIVGWLYPHRPTANPGSFDWQSFYRRQGVVAGLKCGHMENVVRLESNPSTSAGYVVHRLRRLVRGWLVGDLADGATDESSLLQAMLLGHRSQLDRRLNDTFIRAGCVHFLAVSGTHVAILLSFFWALGRLLMLTRRQTATLLLVVVWMYAAIAEPRPPILRAAVMATMYCLSLLMRRPSAHLNWIAAAAVVLTIIDPGSIFGVGFQLSFAATLGATYVARALHQSARNIRRWFLVRKYGEAAAEIIEDVESMAPRSSTQGRALGASFARMLVYGITRLLFVSLGAWIAGAPIVLLHFHRIQPWAPLFSLAVFPLVYIVMLVGFGKLFFAWIAPAVAGWLSLPLAMADRALIGFVEFFAEWPGTSIAVSPPAWWIIAAYYAAMAWVVSRSSEAKPRAKHDEVKAPSVDRHDADLHRRRWYAPTGIAIIGLIGWLLLLRPDERLVIHVLAVGAGSATVIELPGGDTIIYDGGSLSPSDVGANTIVPFLGYRGIRSIERVYVSHPNLDHYNGLLTLIDNIDTGPVVINGDFRAKSPRRSASRFFLDELARRQHLIEVLPAQAESWQIGSVRFEMLWPRDSVTTTRTANDSSIVLRISYGAHSILLTGDIEEEAIQALLVRGDLRADILVWPHHGGVVSNSRAFFDAVSPQAVVLSSRRRISETHNGLVEIVGRTPLYNTADHGAVSITLDPTSVSIATTLDR